jgi:hypothetical protein
MQHPWCRAALRNRRSPVEAVSRRPSAWLLAQVLAHPSDGDGLLVCASKSAMVCRMCLGLAAVDARVTLSLRDSRRALPLTASTQEHRGDSAGLTRPIAQTVWRRPLHHSVACAQDDLLIGQEVHNLA